MSTNEKIEQVFDGLDMLSADNSIPRNIRRGAEDIKRILHNESDPIDIRVASAT